MLLFSEKQIPVLRLWRHNLHLNILHMVRGGNGLTKQISKSMNYWRAAMVLMYLYGASTEFDYLVLLFRMWYLLVVVKYPTHCDKFSLLAEIIAIILSGVIYQTWNLQIFIIWKKIALSCWFATWCDVGADGDTWLLTSLLSMCLLWFQFVWIH